MYILRILSLVHLLLISVLAAQSLIRAKAPAPTAAPLFLRQVSTCDSGSTSCSDGLPGCCGSGQQCTSNTNGVGLCEAPCTGGPTCSGVFNGACCDVGYTCNYQSTICEAMTGSSSPASVSISSPSMTPASAVPSSVTSSSEPSSSPLSKASRSTPSTASITSASSTQGPSSTSKGTESLSATAKPNAGQRLFDHDNGQSVGWFGLLALILGTMM